MLNSLEKMIRFESDKKIEWEKLFGKKTKEKRKMIDETNLGG